MHKGRTAGNVLIGREAEALQHIANQGIAAAIWQRKPASDFQGWVDGLPVEQLPELRITVPLDLVESAVQTACDIKQLPDGPERRLLAGDVAALADIFGKVMGVPNVQIRLDVDDQVMCPRFHIDNISARLLCTYRGPGTQYVATSERDKPNRIGQMTTGAAGLFRGKQWPSGEESTLLHRSPVNTNETGVRLLLVIDPA
ncbi:DUF1826 domain-containing protein [Cohaesibacter celericrescens]|uniref:DUF1826 domain-containing protein n=2 Tax=Cohaesibacter celericrescens TaxID=2067669 RepID=A0A2N5XRQ3_9HYPH|nr:DUF1826 domain-containing protein [Cohaesibacter celericrescens]